MRSAFVKVIFSVIFLLNLCLAGRIFYHQMKDGSFIVAAPLHLGKNQTHMRHQLGKYFHLPQKSSSRQNKHMNIPYEDYLSNDQQVNIDYSPDKQLLLKLRNSCLNNKKGLSGKQKLQQFKSGKCSPVVLVPGILATSLIIQINCQKLSQYSKQIFQSCGWSTCFTLGINKPDPQYLLWVGLELSLKVRAELSQCFGNLFGLLYDKDSTSDEFNNRYNMPAGLSSTWFGNTKNSKPYSKCGSNAIRDLSGQKSILSVLGSQCALKDYARLIDILQVMGYQSGLTLQALPYDFRYGILASSTPQLLPQIVNNLYYTTGKKVVIVAHSLGTLHTLMNLAYFINDQQKQKMIRHYIPITPPWFGTVSAIRNVIFGDSSYFDKASKTGINRYAQKKFAIPSGSSYQLFLRDSFKVNRNQSWMQQILKRIQYEKEGRTKNITYGSNSNQQNGQQDYPLNWFPSKYQKCFDDFFKRNPYCETGLIDFLNTAIFQIDDKKYYGTQQDIQKILRQNLSPDQVQQAISIWSQTKVKNKNLASMPAPGVDTSVILTSVYKTQIFYKYQTKKKDELDDNTFLLPTETTYTPGDLSVPSFSPLVFVAKWIHQKSNGNHSINVVQYCANYRGNKKHYSTITCQCIQNPFKNQLDCTHPCIISDRYLINFVIGILTNSNSNKGYPDDSTKNSIEISDEDIQFRVNQCLNLRKNSWMAPKSPKFHQLFVK